MAKGDIIRFPRRDEASRFHHADGELPASSQARRTGETRNSIRANAAEGSGEDAGVSSASASSFIQVGDAVHAVVLRLAGGFPKIRGPVRLSGGGTVTAPVVQSPPGEGEER